MVKQQPRYVDLKRCIACGLCSTACPQEEPADASSRPKRTKAIYTLFPQAVPQGYEIDATSCLHLTGQKKCAICQHVCPADAVDFSQTEKLHELSVGSLIIATGSTTWKPETENPWGHGRHDNVLTALEFEAYLSRLGKKGNRLLRPSDDKPVRSIAIVLCAGSRDLRAHAYCSSVCCMAAVKQAVAAKQRDPSLRVTVFYQDLRAHGKGFDRYIEKARTEHSILFVKSRPFCLDTASQEHSLRVRYSSESGKQIEEKNDLVILATALRTPDTVLRLVDESGVRLTRGNFAAVSNFTPVSCSKPGIYACGTASGPKDITQSVAGGSAVAACAAGDLMAARGELTKKRRYPKEKSFQNDPARVGVFLCHCGTNIADVLGMDDLQAYSSKLPNVAHVEQLEFGCSEDSISAISRSIRTHNLNRVVIGACSPRTHESIFRESLRMSGLNESMLVIANLRNQNSWIHAADHKSATKKACRQLSGAVHKILLQQPSEKNEISVSSAALVVGGGLTGMMTSLSLARQGYPVHLVERSDHLGGMARLLDYTWSGEEIRPQLEDIDQRVRNNPNITLHMECEVTASEGFAGNFTTTATGKNRKTESIRHGAVIVATGGKRYQPVKEYGYGEMPGVYTGIEFDVLRKIGDTQVKNAKQFIFIQCVGSREPGRNYCSKVCCTHSINTAIQLKKEDPGRQISILYRDIRTYGEREYLYKMARDLGIMFIRYQLDNKPKISKNGGKIQVSVMDHVLQQPVHITTDVLVLAEAILPNNSAQTVSDLFFIPADKDGFLQEAHSKLRPVDTYKKGVFIAGLAQYPKPVEESIIQAQAAAGRAATLLSKPKIELDPVRAHLVEDKCDHCGLCVESCPYGALSVLHKEETETELVVINQALCTGCGHCQAACPKEGVAINGFSPDQLKAELLAVLEDDNESN